MGDVDEQAGVSKMRQVRIVGKRRRGAVLPLMMIAVVVLLTMAVGLLSLGYHGRLAGVRSASEIAARSAADSALAEAICQMNVKLQVKPWSDSSLPVTSGQSLPNAEATYAYVVTKGSGGAYEVEAVGSSGSSTRTVDSTLRLKGPFDFAVFAEDTLELKNGSLVDWYNFDADDHAMQLGTNSTNSGAIILKNGTTINGDVVVGAGGEPATVIDQHAGVTITGSTYAMPYTQVLLPVSVPVALLSLPSEGIIDKSMTISSNAHYDSIDLGNSKVLTIDEPVMLYIARDIELGNSAEIRIGGSSDGDDDASLILYLGGDLEAKNSSGLNNLTQEAGRFELYCLSSCQSIDLKNSSDFYGAIYAPSANVLLRNSADVYGSIVADTFELKNSATVYYDTSLRDRSENDEAVRVVIERWTEQ